ncbi:MAG: hypothetical protein ACO1NO_00720 [Burkholderiaceae bacterium]
MKNVLNIFSRPDAERTKRASAPGFREPTLYSSQPSARPAPAAHQAPRREARPETPEDMPDIPFDYPGIVAFFQKTVSGRKSPFNALVQAADRLQEFIPDEVSRLRAAYALCSEKWSPEVLALAIQNHIADIDTVCTKAKSSKSLQADGRSRQLRAESADLQRQNAGLKAEIDQLKASLETLQARFDSNQSKISALDQQAQCIEGDANSVTFLEQAAENLKNDLLAKKILLGLN